MATMRPVARPYRDFLTPFLHRQFTNAALLTLCVCYAEAVWMGEWHPLWKWFPIGPAGLRTLMIFISSLAVFMLRVAQLHVGSRATKSLLGTLILLGPSYAAIQTAVCYIFSAWWYSEVYIWSSSAKAELGWVDQGRPYERPRLNERPIYLRSMFFSLAVVQSIIHLYQDYDKVTVPLRRADGEVGSRKLLRQNDTPLLQIRSSVPRILQVILFRVTFATFVGAITYALLLRRAAWSSAFLVARTIWSLPKSAKPSTWPPLLDFVTVRFTVQGAFLILLWESTNLAFSAYVAQEPLKKGRPLTEDSKDPNGSLLSGLKSRKEVPKSYAFWELNLITQRFPERRRMFFLDMDRPGGSTWLQILNVCMAEFNGIMQRIQAFQGPQPTPTDPEGKQPNLQTLPKIAEPLKEDNIFRAPPPPADRLERIQRQVGAFAKSHGQKPGAQPVNDITSQTQQLVQYGTDKLEYGMNQLQYGADKTQQLVQYGTDKLVSDEQKGKVKQQKDKLLQYGTDILLSEEQREKLKQQKDKLYQQKDKLYQQKEKLKPQNVKSKLNDYLFRILGTPFGQPFRETFSRRVTAIVLGTPHSEPGFIIDAAQAISALAVHSLREDVYGQVQKDVPNLIRTLASTITTVQRFLQSLQPHWSDVRFKDEDREKVVDVNLVLMALREGLEDVLGSFGEFFEYIGISEEEVRAAKECLREREKGGEGGKEMQERRKEGH